MKLVVSYPAISFHRPINPFLPNINSQSHTHILLLLLLLYSIIIHPHPLDQFLYRSFCYSNNMKTPAPYFKTLVLLQKKTTTETTTTMTKMNRIEPRNFFDAGRNFRRCCCCCWWWWFHFIFHSVLFSVVHVVVVYLAIDSDCLDTWNGCSQRVSAIKLECFKCRPYKHTRAHTHIHTHANLACACVCAGGRACACVQVCMCVDSIASYVTCERTSCINELSL